MKALRVSLMVGLFVLPAALLATSVNAQTADHLKCYKIKDPVKLAGVVDLSSPQFGPENGCIISKAKFFCVPATKAAVSAIDKATGRPITPLPVTGPDPGDRICYKLKCPEPFPADQQVTDQFGTRTVSKFKPFLLCTPATKEDRNPEAPDAPVITSDFDLECPEILADVEP